MGPLLFVYASDRSLESIAVYVGGALCGSIVLIGFLVSISSLTLFVGGRGEQADLGFQAILIMASYPLDIFGGAHEGGAVHAHPGGVRDGPARLAAARLRPGHGARAARRPRAFFALLGIVLFRLGLRRYASGAVWTRA